MNLNLSTTAGSTATQTTLIFLPQHICVHPPLKMLVGGKRKEYKKTPKSFITMFTNTKLSKGQAGLWSQSQFKVKLCLWWKSKVLWGVCLIAAQEGNFDWMKRISVVQKQDWLWKLIWELMEDEFLLSPQIVPWTCWRRCCPSFWARILHPHQHSQSALPAADNSCWVSGVKCNEADKEQLLSACVCVGVFVSLCGDTEDGGV